MLEKGVLLFLVLLILLMFPWLKPRCFKFICKELIGERRASIQSHILHVSLSSVACGDLISKRSGCQDRKIKWCLIVVHFYMWKIGCALDVTSMFWCVRTVTNHTGLHCILESVLALSESISATELRGPCILDLNDPASGTWMYVYTPGHSGSVTLRLKQLWSLGW